MENFIREKYGDNVFFMTAMAAILNFNSEEISAIKLFIEREKVQEIIISSDTSCLIINSVLKNKNEFGSHAETLIKNIVLENKDALAKANSEVEKQKIIANALVKNEAQEICTPNFFLSEISANKIIVKGIITTKSNNEIIELNFNNN